MMPVPIRHRSPISRLAGLSCACAVIAWSALALAQARPGNIECKTTETQAECHTRLKCKSDEELEDCQSRLRDSDASRRDRSGSDRSGNDRGDRRDRGDRGDRGDRRSDRNRDRGDRSSRRERGGSDRGGGRNRGGDRSRSRGGSGGGGGGGGGGDSDFVANKTFGLGLEIGEPTGLIGKVFLSDSGALDFGIGWIYRHYYYDDGLHIYLDYLWHPVSLASTESLELPLYIGIGGRYWDFDYCNNRFCYDGTALGIRVPVGIAFDFNNAPIDIFLQVVPVFDFITDDYYDRYRDRTHFGIDLSAGIRFWF